MIFVNQLQLDQVNYLIEQSIRGNHILFQPEVLKRVAIKTQPLAQDRSEEAEQVLEQMILCDTISKKQNFLAKLDPDMYEDVARVYLNIVQNSIQDKKRGAH